MWRWLSEILLAVAGLVLIADGYVLHRITLDYGEFYWLDPYISHGTLGIVLLAAALLDILCSSGNQLPKG
mgnify:CR=1 FL=1